MQTALFRIWTLFAEPIFFDDNHYAIHISVKIIHFWLDSYKFQFIEWLNKILKFISIFLLIIWFGK